MLFRSVAFSELLPEIKIPVFEVVGPPSVQAAKITKNGRIGVIGTAATIKSGAYETALLRENPELFVTAAECPLLVPLVENGRTDPDDIAVQTIVRDYLAPVLSDDIDTLILGCTHYPLLRGVISRIAPDITLVDSGAATAEFAAAKLRELELLSGKSEPGEHRFYVTDSTESFEPLATLFLEDNISGSVYKTTLDA